MIGIVGFGFVGQAVYAALQDPSSAVVYDKHKKAYRDSAPLLNTDAIFICVSTPTTDQGCQDLSAVADILAWLNDSNYQGLVILKSTVLYKHAEPHIKGLRVVFNPEFLSQNTASQDFFSMPVVLGGDARDCIAAREIYETQFDLLCPTEFILCTAEEACQLKYVHNIYHAYKALFWNWVCEITGNHRKLCQLYRQIRPKSLEMERVAADGKMGVGGACFPKDTAAFNHEYPHELTRFILNYNGRLRPEYKGWSGSND